MKIEKSYIARFNEAESRGLEICDNKSHGSHTETYSLIRQFLADKLPGSTVGNRAQETVNPEAQMQHRFARELAR